MKHWTHLDKLSIQHNFMSFWENLQPPSIFSQFVSLFSKPTSSNHVSEAWTRDPGVEISVDLRDRALRGITSCSINARLQLIQFKVVHRLHYSKTRLNRLFPSISPLCDKCKVSNGTLGHLLFFCPLLENFWSESFQLYSTVYKKTIIPDV